MLVEFAGQLACKSAVTSRMYAISLRKPSAKAAQRSTKIVTKIDAKSFPGGPRGSPNRPENSPGSLLGLSSAPKQLPGTIRSVIDVPRDRPGSIPGAPGESSRATRSARKSARERLGASQGDRNRVQDASRSGKSAFSLRTSLAHCFRIGFSTIFVDFQVLRKMCELSKVPRLSAKSRVRPFALRVTSLERCCLENHEK